MVFKFLWWKIILVSKPNRNIGPGYLHRYHLIPKNKWLNIYLHCFHRSDYDRALHDHPWNSLSFMLKGDLSELYMPSLDYPDVVRRRSVKRFMPYYRPATFSHRIILNSDCAWTLFITGRVIRPWGFYAEEGWMHKDEFLERIGYDEGVET